MRCVHDGCMAGSGHACACLTRKKEEGRDNAIMVASGQGMSRGRARAPHSGPGKRVALLIIREGDRRSDCQDEGL